MLCPGGPQARSPPYRKQWEIPGQLYTTGTRWAHPPNSTASYGTADSCVFAEKAGS